MFQSCMRLRTTLAKSNMYATNQFNLVLVRPNLYYYICKKNFKGTSQRVQYIQHNCTHYLLTERCGDHIRALAQ